MSHVHEKGKICDPSSKDHYLEPVSRDASVKLFYLKCWRTKESWEIKIPATKRMILCRLGDKIYVDCVEQKKKNYKSINLANLIVELKVWRCSNWRDRSFDLSSTRGRAFCKENIIKNWLVRVLGSKLPISI